MFRAAGARRLISTTPALRKTATEQAKETLESANRKFGDAGVAGIDKGQQATQSAKEAIGMGAKDAQGKASEMAGSAKGTGNEMSGKASEMAGSAKGTASEMSGKAEGKAEELKGKAKGTAEEIKGKM
ncbi:MAG: hypothetical protein M1828_007265 [Chrysothrix sp. TS-e1954]|nr:MAG: hypothetical protein M1828_007265 [Chrysothrix sp. TS-e1954]